jgi:hypothetical protein
MSDREPKQLRTVTFAGSPNGLWGAACAADGSFLAIGEGPTALVVPASGAELSGVSAEEPWTVSAPGVELRIEGLGEAVHSEDPPGFEQLCRVHGRIAVEDAERAVDVLGRRSSLSGVVVGDLDSVRDVSAYFEPADGIALTALRPRKRRGGHDRDVVLAAVLEEGGPHAVEDPRLSTTYSAGGDPWRVGLELWLAGEDESTKYPVRATGEVAGPGAHETVDGIDVSAAPLRWHSRGRLGAGVYLLMRAR